MAGNEEPVSPAVSHTVNSDCRIVTLDTSPRSSAWLPAKPLHFREGS